jgi:hypothetical protein
MVCAAYMLYVVKAAVTVDMMLDANMCKYSERVTHGA